jgi:5-bromo-4-chloroindolyl phosphate hydrolysis protein
MESALYALLGTVVGGLISMILQKLKYDQELKIRREENKTEFMAETTARHFLSHKGYTDRSFETLKNHLGGFEDNELRKILVRAGAIRFFRDDGSEWWRLLSRMEEFIEKKRDRSEG